MDSKPDDLAESNNDLVESMTERRQARSRTESQTDCLAERQIFIASRGSAANERDDAPDCHRRRQIRLGWHDLCTLI